MPEPEGKEWNWFVLDVNPEPWAIGPISVGRKGGKMFPMVSRNEQLWNYKQAIKEAIGDTHIWIEGDVELIMFFWRDRAEYVTPQARTHRKHQADLTNMFKATEDALQGVLFKNDKDVQMYHAEIVEQGPNVHGRVVIGVREKFQTWLSTLPIDVQQEADGLSDVSFDNTWGG